MIAAAFTIGERPNNPRKWTPDEPVCIDDVSTPGSAFGGTFLGLSFFPYIYKYINSTLFLPFKSFLQNSNFSKIYIMKLPEICLRPPGKLK